MLGVSTLRTAGVFLRRIPSLFVSVGYFLPFSFPLWFLTNADLNISISKSISIFLFQNDVRNGFSKTKITEIFCFCICLACVRFSITIITYYGKTYKYFPFNIPTDVYRIYQ